MLDVCKMFVCDIVYSLLRYRPNTRYTDYTMTNYRRIITTAAHNYFYFVNEIFRQP